MIYARASFGMLFTERMLSPYARRRAPDRPRTVRTFLLQTVALTTVAMLVSPLDGVAQTSANDSIEEIQVTATRRPISVHEVSSAVAVIGAEEVRAGKLTTDALAAQPGVFLQQTTPGQGAAIVRGLKGSEVLHLVDGFRLNNAIFRNAPTQYLALVAPGTVDRIEILRGSPASLYGSDAVGGIVQVVNRMPTLSGGGTLYDGELGVGIDSAERERSGHVSLEASTGRVAVLVSADILETGNRRVGGGGRVGPSGFRSESARGAVLFSAAPDSSWLLDLQYGRQPKTPRIDELIPGFGQTEPASDEFFFAPNERRFAHLQHRRQEGWFGADWVVDLGWQRIVDDRVSRDFGAAEQRRENNASDLYGVIVTANGQLSAGSWVSGFEDYFDEVSSRRIEVDTSTGARTTVRPRFPDGSEVRQGALFAQAALPFAERHTLSGGVRFSVIDVDLASTSTSLARSFSFDDVSADLGWTFDVADDIQVVANASVGFRAPNVFDLGSLGERPGNRFNVPSPGLESEHVTQLDVGLRRRTEALQAEIVLWSLSYDDRLTSVATGDQTASGRDIVQTQNAASAELWGIEASGRYALSESTVAEWVVNATRGEQTISGGLTEPGDRVPPVNGRVGLMFSLRDELSIEPYVVFAAKQDRLSPRDVRDPRIDPSGTDGWMTANVRGRWQPNDAWLVTLALQNLFDEAYRTHGSGLDAPGRNLRLALRYFW